MVQDTHTRVITFRWLFACIAIVIVLRMVIGPAILLIVDKPDRYLVMPRWPQPDSTGQVAEHSPSQIVEAVVFFEDIIINRGILGKRILLNNFLVPLGMAAFVLLVGELAIIRRKKNLGTRTAMLAILTLIGAAALIGVRVLAGGNERMLILDNGVSRVAVTGPFSYQQDPAFIEIYIPVIHGVYVCAGATPCEFPEGSIASVSRASLHLKPGTPNKLVLSDGATEVVLPAAF